jgi:hypothetical protein
MASNSKAGLSKLQREDFLRDHGFTPLRSGKGSHEIWEHAALKELAKTHKIDCPSNLLHNPAQKPWEHPLPDNPASGTWHRISKHAQWCQQTVEALKGATQEAEARRRIVREFMEAKKEFCDWKRETRHRVKAGLEAAEPPVSYTELKARQQRFLQQKQGL